MDCPVFSSESGEREGELTPYKCPITYCPPSEDSHHSSGGNFSYAICIKYIDDKDPNNQQFVKKVCATRTSYCDLNCNILTQEGSHYYNTAMNSNYSRYFAIGCEGGDQTISNNITEITTLNNPSPTPSTSEPAIEPPIATETPVTSASVYQMQLTLMPCLLIILLTIGLIQKKF